MRNKICVHKNSVRDVVISTKQNEDSCGDSNEQDHKRRHKDVKQGDNNNKHGGQKNTEQNERQEEKMSADWHRTEEKKQALRSLIKKKKRFYKTWLFINFVICLFISSRMFNL